ncbi:hypothetical protein RFI_07450 [Reticulomyxa filosa]|uniref:Uncharacterized protein n=1 Tax=Reticulomyxa filosa TaxID=46433 RepID=X6NTQ2_RETFI|nr:hypothetical protein RFI_07450 [Reticulomyxa filosa]|eukprot:ETO29670.1 hypothetical protein RFI_07450 [Reticulomyxa filosa]
MEISSRLFYLKVEEFHILLLLSLSGMLPRKSQQCQHLQRVQENLNLNFMKMWNVMFSKMKHGTDIDVSVQLAMGKNKHQTCKLCGGMNKDNKQTQQIKLTIKEVRIILENWMRLISINFGWIDEFNKIIAQYVNNCIFCFK